MRYHEADTEWLFEEAMIIDVLLKRAYRLDDYQNFKHLSEEQRKIFIEVGSRVKAHQELREALSDKP